MLDTLDRVFTQVSTSIPELAFAVRLWDGSERRYGTREPDFVMVIADPDAVGEVVGRGSMGFGEAYMTGRVDVEGDLQGLLELAWHPEVRTIHLGVRDKARLLPGVIRGRNDRRRARANVQHHYDLGNDFYALWLDESMTYSCAYWDDDCVTLEEAQSAKYEHLCRKLHLHEGDHLVDIGCGWGGMLHYAAEHYGVTGVGYTLSSEQEAYANERLRDAGLYPKVRVLLEDYREAKGTFDKFVSVGMFEHVGREYYDTFFQRAATLLKPGGIGVLHTIGKDVEGETDEWIRTYIFPGGFLPSIAQFADPMGRQGLVLTDLENLRLHYARTLDAWAERFDEHALEIGERFDETFVRMWRLYLHASSVGFKRGSIRVYQATFTHGLRDDLPMTRCHLYQSSGRPRGWRG